MAKAKKTLALFLVFAVFTCSFLCVSAKAYQTEESPIICYGSMDEIQPRLTYFGTVSVGISKTDGNIVARGDYTSFANGIDVQLIVAVEKKSGSSWTQVEFNSQKYSPGRGGNILSATYENPPSGTYRAVTTAIALDNNYILETVKIISTKTITI